ncbi:PREDICTED: protein Mis18-alpha isoform X2 [Cercocebus atys]|uniref:protein Mis18-alpha isoform X2 n=1 Tax=Cercocebus atys TaxID=9531 RepID=UPI0005F505E0|nr:PREDICTED: protein Mis18-alpha isoform X2 [Cercocebus atys]
MAGVRALRCSRGCAGGCECGDKGKGSDSSLLGKRLSEDSSRHQLLQKWASMWSSVSEDASVADTEKARLEEAGAAEERPLVFLCCGCRRPLGDSLSWVASQEDTNCILLRLCPRPGFFGIVCCCLSSPAVTSVQVIIQVFPVMFLWIRNRSYPNVKRKMVASCRLCTVRGARSILATCTDARPRILITRETCFVSVLKPLKDGRCLESITNEAVGGRIKIVLCHL